MDEFKPSGKGSSVSNSEFLAELLRAAPRGTTVWTCAFIGNPNGVEPGAWGGQPYNPAMMSGHVDGWLRQNTYFSVSAVKLGDDGRYHRKKDNFARLLALVADDANPDDLAGSPSYVLYTSPGKTQVGVLLDATDPDCENQILIAALIRAMARQGLVQLDKAGNNLVRYVRLPVGQNQKPRESGHFDHQLYAWAPSIRLTLDDAAAVFGIDLDDIKRSLVTTTTVDGLSMGPSEMQDEKIRRLTQSILVGDGLHDATRDMAASLIASGALPGTVTTLIQTLMECSNARRTRPQEWQQRYDDIGRLVRDASKFALQRQTATVIDPQTGEITEDRKMFASIGTLLQSMRAAEYVLHGYLERNAISLHYGASGIGKSFLQVGMLASIATGTSWYGVTVKQGLVIVIIGEGYNGFVKRLQAWALKNNVDLSKAPIYISKRPAQLVDGVNAASIAAEIDEIVKETVANPALIVIDTLARNIGDGDENAAKDVGLFISNIDLMIRARYECHVAVVHHSGHNQERARGSSALRAAVDQEFWIQGGNGKLTLSCTKMKDGELPPDRQFKIVNVPLGDDASGNEMHSGYLEIDGDPLDFEFAKSADGKVVRARDVAMVIHESGWDNIVALAASIGVSERNVKYALARVKESTNPFLIKDGKGYALADWALNELGNSGETVMRNMREGRPRPSEEV